MILPEISGKDPVPVNPTSFPSRYPDITRDIKRKIVLCLGALPMCIHTCIKFH